MPRRMHCSRRALDPGRVRIVVGGAERAVLPRLARDLIAADEIEACKFVVP